MSRRKYTIEFKQEAVLLIHLSEQSIYAIDQNFGINDNMLHRCIVGSRNLLSLRAQVIAQLSSATFGIYMVRTMVLILLASGSFGFVLSGQAYTPLIGVPLATLAN